MTGQNRLEVLSGGGAPFQGKNGQSIICIGCCQDGARALPQSEARCVKGVLQISQLQNRKKEKKGEWVGGKFFQESLILPSTGQEKNIAQKQEQISALTVHLIFHRFSYHFSSFFISFFIVFHRSFFIVFHRLVFIVFHRLTVV